MKDISDWINIFFISIAVLFILNMFSPKVNYCQSNLDEKVIKNYKENCTEYYVFDEKEPEIKSPNIQLDEKDLKIQELEKELQNYKERIEDFRSQNNIWESLVKNSVLNLEKDIQN